MAVPTGDQVARTQSLDTAPAARLFGEFSSGMAKTEGPSRIRLDGVIAEGGKGKGVALISVDGQSSIAYGVDDTIGLNYTLADVQKDKVIIRSSAGTKEIKLPERPAPQGIVPSR